MGQFILRMPNKLNSNQRIGEACINQYIGGHK